MTPIRALLVQDSGDTRTARLLEAEHDIKVVGSSGPGHAVEAVKRHRPDVVVLESGNEVQALSVIEEVMGRQPRPILVIADGAVSRDKALGAGAVDILPRAPVTGDADGKALRKRVRQVSMVGVIRHVRGRARGAKPVALLPVVGIAASAGGPQAVAEVLRGLGSIRGPVLVVQHLHPDFIDGFRDWMQRDSPIPVELAVDGAILEAGRVYLAPANLHLKVGPGLTAVLDAKPVTLHRPSADVLFESLARYAAERSIAALLTGMGDDGAAGLLAIRRVGGTTIAQDQGSSAVYGMPRAASRLGAALEVLPLDRIASAIVKAAEDVT
jgi:two-component system chemotaxis response regulator CheB